MLAVSTLFVTMPRATDSQVMASAVSARRPAAASHSAGPVVGRKPISRATTMTRASASIVWMTLPMTWPVRTDERATAIVRKRAMMPPVMSIATEIAVPWAAPATVIRRIPGTTYAMYSARPPDDTAEAGAERAAEDVHEQQQEHDRDAGDEEGQRGVAAHPAEVAAQHRRRVGQDVADTQSSEGHLLLVGVAGERQEDVVEIGRLDRRAR